VSKCKSTNCFGTTNRDMLYEDRYDGIAGEHAGSTDHKAEKRFRGQSRKGYGIVHIDILTAHKNLNVLLLRSEIDRRVTGSHSDSQMKFLKCSLV
jgi:hypothetical protein